ncbi:metallophosphoesterase [Portibacter lacus]|uniref:Metallophosphatase n=1 Tax=Portibacter lacus TaxID=1099794 RepID=A0AA37SSN4_9BACT|nr:metallophosphoesterase [Portibacter lacus]GLR17270.1 metallophosphatase [Portibacter lacus]
MKSKLFKIGLDKHLALVLMAMIMLCSGCSSLNIGADPAKKPFTIVVLPDTQNYADVREKWAQSHFNIPDQRFCFYEQTKWIKNNKKKLNIQMVAHVGDIVQYDYPDEWAIADTAFTTIDNTVPYILSLGNHDMGCEIKPGTAHSRETKVNNYFPPSRFENNPIYQYGGNLDNRSDNYFLTFEEAGMKFLMLSLEFKPRDEALAWANKVVAAHPNHQCIIVTHAYLMKNGQRFTSLNYDIEGNAGEEMWEKLVSLHKNIFMVVCGHTEPNARLVSKGVHGNNVYQLLSDFQFEKGGQGFLRIMKFYPEEKRIDVSTYSPVLKEYKEDPRNKFSLEFNLEQD